MNDERLVREIWKQLPHRRVVGEALVRAVGARAWERPRFARFRRFFERCGVPDPWDPGAAEFSAALGEVGVAQRKTVAPHAAPPPAPGAPKAPSLPNVPRAPAAPPPSAAEPRGESGKPAPRIGETRRDDTAELKKKLAETEKKRANPAHANPFKVNQPVAKLPMRPDRAEGAPGGPVSRPSAPLPRPAAAPARPGGSAPRPFRVPLEAVRRPAVPDGPEEIVEVAPAPRSAPGGLGDFGMGGGWDEDDLPKGPPPRVEERAPSLAVDGPGAPPTLASAPSPERAPAPVVPVAVRPAEGAAASAPTAAGAARPTERAAATTPAPAAAPPALGRPPVAAEPTRPGAPGPRPGPPPRPGGAGGLDDLFGMGGPAGGDNTRVRMPKREEADPSRPRRPMVTPDAELGKGAVDRRPPPPKPPSVTPSGPGPRPPVAEPEDAD